MTSTCGRLATLLLSGAFFAAPFSQAFADEADGKTDSSAPTGIPSPSIATSIPALADPGGIRSALAAKGVAFQLNYIGEALSDVSGGMRRGTIYDGRFELVIDADLEKMFGWTGAAVHMNVYQIHGTGLSRYNIGSIMPVSTIEALPSTRLYEAWFEQKFASGMVGVRFGQLAADTEFFLSKFAGPLVNGTYGWPAIFATNMPSGGPAYPLSTPGVRVKFTPTDQFTYLLALFNGDPAGPGAGDPQRRDNNGLGFRLSDPPLLMTEAQYSYTLSKDAGLNGTVKAGGWEHFGQFSSNRFDTAGLLLADPASNGTPKRLRGNFGVYGILDQMLYHIPKADPDKGLGVFARVSASPQDRNLVNFYADGGVNLTGMIPGRSDDAIALALGYAHISKSASLYDQDVNAFSSVTGPVRDYEANVELTYVYQVIPGWSIQPDLQYFFHPGGHVANPFNPNGSAIPNATVIGVRTTINF